MKQTAAHIPHTLNDKGYPANWPQPTPSTGVAASKSVVNTITDAQKKALYEREISTRELAKLFGVREAWLSTLFPGKRPGFLRSKKILTESRREYRKRYAADVVAGTMTVHQAATASRVPYRTMARIVKALKEANGTKTQI